MSDTKAFSNPPHFDDFDEKNNFLRVLIRPGIPVQTRELNQMQTILQNQIANNSSYSFRNGARIVNGETALVDKLPFVTVTSLTDGNAQNYIGAKVQRIVSNVVVHEAVVLAVVKKTGSDPDALYLSYTGADSLTHSSTFQAGESLTITFVDTTLPLETTTVIANGNALGFSVNEGIYYFKSHFIHVPKQFAVINKFSNVPSAEAVSVGFSIYESVVTPEEDVSLYDNALGTPNETAPGAYRYRMQAFLTTKRELENQTPSGVVTDNEDALPDDLTDVSTYYELAVVKFGQIQLKPRSDENTSVLEQTLARRTFDESGDYVVDDFIISLREHLNTSTTKTGTYSQSARTITVNVTSHGLTIGDPVIHDFTSGNSIDDTYKVASTPTLNSYTVIARDSQTTSGNVSITFNGNRGQYTQAEGGDEAKLAITLDKGKAYVRGFEIETRGNTFLDMNKARVTETQQNAIVQLQYGTAFYVYSANATQNLANPVLNAQASLKDGGGTVRGTAFIRAFKFDSVQTISATSKNVYRLDVIGVSFNAGYSFNNIATIEAAGTYAFVGTVVPSPGIGYIANAKESTQIYELPYGFSKTVVPQIFSRYYEKTVTTASGGVGQPTTITFATETGGETFDDETFNFTVYVNDGGGKSGIPLSVVLTNSSKTATIDVTNIVGQNKGGIAATVISKTFKTDSVERSKTLTTATTYTVAAASKITLPNTDVFEILSIYSGSNDITEFYTLDNGQRDTLYDFGSLTIKQGYQVPSGNVDIVFTYFAHGAGDFFTVDSYTNVTYGDIPEYQDTQNKKFFLGKCIDYRQAKSNATTLVKNGAHSFTGNDPAFVTTEYYLSRMDKVVLTNRGEFQVVQGVPSLVPELPQEPVDAISLYNIYVPAYTFSIKDVSISQLRHQRFTMKDISKIVTRLENVEQATSLSLLEMKINSKQDLDKFRNGFFVDNFQTQTAGMIEDPYHNIGHDLTNAELRPTNNTVGINLERNADSGLKVHADGNITLNYTETEFASQMLASTTIRLQPYALANFIGNLDIVPSSDIWFDTATVETFMDRTGTLVARYFFDKGTLYPKYLVGTTWDFTSGIWTNVATGKKATTQETVDLFKAIKAAPDNITGMGATSSTTQVSSTTSSTAVPYIRSRLVTFAATGLQPNVRVYLKFDGIDISAYAGLSEATIGQPLIVGGGGNINGVFRIPNTDTLKFRTGKRHVVVTDIAGNGETYDATVCDCFYEAAGTLITTTNTFVNTRTPVISSRVHDPVAQSFFVKDDQFKEGVFISSIDVYFGSGISPATNSDSVRLELRNMVNGYPGTDIAANGRVVVPASAIYGSKDASVATRFTFQSPIYLEDGNEYCFVLVSKSEVINVWAAKLGQKNVLAGETVPNSGQEISKQPYLGSMFLSQNDTTWTAEQTTDLKFRINRCKFGSTGSLTMINKVPTTEVGTAYDEYRSQLDANPFLFTNGSTQMRVFDWGHGFQVGNKVKLTNPKVTTGNVGTVSYNGVPASAIYTVGANNPNGLDIVAVDTPLTSTVAYSQTATTITISLANAPFAVGDPVTLDFQSGAATDGDYTVASVTTSNFTVTSSVSQTTSGNVSVVVDEGFGTYIVTLGSSATATGRAGGASNVASRRIDYSTLRLLSDAVVLNGTNIGYKYRGRVFSTGALTAFNNINPNTEVLMPAQYSVVESADSSLTLQATMTSSKDTISPIFNEQRCSFVVQKNLINNTVDRYNGKLFGAVARYVQRPVTVINPSNEINVYLDLNLPSNSSVKVYYRTGQTDVSGSWTEMSLAVGETLVNSDDPTFFKETKFSTEGVTIPNFFVSQVKVVLLSADRSRVPRVKNFRSVAVMNI